MAEKVGVQIVVSDDFNEDGRRVLKVDAKDLESDLVVTLRTKVSAQPLDLRELFEHNARYFSEEDPEENAALIAVCYAAAKKVVVDG